ncbi:MAG: hypothetical protein ACI9A2_002485, partial [Halioglobus sp.]
MSEPTQVYEHPLQQVLSPFLGPDAPPVVEDAYAV